MNARLLSIGISQEDIENLPLDELLAEVREKYLGIFADIYEGNNEMLSSLSDLAGIDISALPSFLEDTHDYMEILSDGIDFANLDDSLSTVIDQFENVAAAAGMMTGSVIGSTGVSVGTDKSTSSSPGGSASGNVSFIDAVKSLEDESVPMLNNVADAFAGEESSDNSSQSIAGSVNKAKEAIAGSSSGKKNHPKARKAPVKIPAPFWKQCLPNPRPRWMRKPEFCPDPEMAGTERRAFKYPGKPEKYRRRYPYTEFRRKYISAWCKCRRISRCKRRHFQRCQKCTGI